MLNVTYDCGKLNIVPNISIPPVVHCSYGDTGVKINFQIYKGKTLFEIPDGCEAYVIGVRSDGANWGPIEVTQESKTRISFILDDVITGFEGSSVAQVSFNKQEGDKVYTVGTGNFAIMVEAATWHLGTAYTDDVSTYRNILRYVQKSIKAANSIISKADAMLDSAVDAAKTEVNNNLPGYLQDWLNKHVGVSSDLTDKTLTLENASADAKAVGDKLKTLDETTIPRLKTVEARTGFLSSSMEEMDACCAEVNDTLRAINNFLVIAKKLHEPVYLLDTDGNKLLTTDGKAILVSL